jgi:polyhydroxyalkanoate synthesis regulator phasin
MPQSKSSSSGKSSGGSTRSRRATGRASSSAQSQQSMKEQLQRFLDPREVVVVTRDRLQETLDEAVERGRITRDDATALLTDVLQRGRKQTDDLREDIEGLLTGARNTTRRSVSGSAERVLREVDRARRVAGVGPTFPILGYDDLTAAQVTERLGDLSAPELRKVRDYEKRNANRKSVLAAVEQKLK